MLKLKNHKVSFKDGGGGKLDSACSVVDLEILRGGFGWTKMPAQLESKIKKGHQSFLTHRNKFSQYHSS